MVEEADDLQGRIELGRLASGDYLGERGGLLGGLELANVKALTAVVIYEIAKEQLAIILRERPVVPEELAQMLTTQRNAEEQPHRSALLDPQPPHLCNLFSDQEVFSHKLSVGNVARVSRVG